MKVLHVLSSTVLFALAVALGASAQDVKTDYDHHANFSQYHT
jgi:hypothetical protein